MYDNSKVFISASITVADYWNDRDQVLKIVEEQYLEWVFEPATTLAESRNCAIAAFTLLLPFFEGFARIKARDFSDNGAGNHFRTEWSKFLVHLRDVQGDKSETVLKASKAWSDARCGVLHAGRLKLGVIVQWNDACETVFHPLAKNVVLVNVLQLVPAVKCYFQDELARLRNDPEALQLLRDAYFTAHEDICQKYKDLRLPKSVDKVPSAVE